MLLSLSNDVLRRAWAFAALMLGCAIGSALERLSQPRSYTASASFVTETGSQPSRRAEIGLPLLAAAVNAPSDIGSIMPYSRRPSLGGAPTPLASAPPVAPLDPGFYWTLLHSRALLVAVARGRFAIQTPTGVRVGTAADHYQLPAGPEGARIEDAARRLDRELEVTYSVESN